MGKTTMPDSTGSAGRNRPTGARRIADICAELRLVVEPELRSAVTRPEHHPQRDRLLGDYRRTLLTAIRDDARVNRLELRALAGEVSKRCGVDLTETPLGSDLLARIDQSANCITQMDPYVDGETELKWWLALTQLHLDGLLLADRLLRARPGERLGRWRLPRQRFEFLGFSGFGGGQSLVTALETAVPDVFRVNPFDTYMPLLLHLLAHHVFAGKRFSFVEAFATTFGWIHRSGFGKLRGLAGDTVRFDGLEHLHNAELFDPATRRTRHNVIIAASHRMGYLDWPLFFSPLRRLRLGVWVNNAFFGPGVARKIARDRYSVPVSGSHTPPLEVSLAHTADLMIHAQVPVFIMVDGRQPSLFYGQQMRVKRGVRLAVNEAIRRSRGSGRRTYVLPLSLNDPVAFVQGRRDVIRVTFHPPVLVESVVELERPERRRGTGAPQAEPGAAERVGQPLADPLLNHLEALYLLNTAHAEQGLPCPRIVAAAERRLRNLRREPLLKRLFHTSLADLARQAAQVTEPAPAPGLRARRE